MSTTPDMTNKIANFVTQITPDIITLRHDLHAQPELGFEEHETAGRILDHLRPLTHLDIQTNVAKTGVVATLNAGKPGPCVALRADMDCLPIQEQSNLPYASKHPGKMHACGHDGHTACLVGAANVLSQIAEDLPGKIKFIFQPAEEGGGGAAVMCDQGVLENPKVDAIFALHGWPDLELGKVGAPKGPAMASADFFSVTIQGVGAHAAYPHRSIDPVLITAHVVLALQTIASRSIDPLEAVVVTVAKINAGTANNIIPTKAQIEGTLRTLDPQVRETALARFKQIVQQTAAAYGATADIRFGIGYPVLVNDRHTAEFVDAVARDILGPQQVIDSVPPCMGGEDFAFYAQRVPAAFWRLGVRQPDAAVQPTLHQPTYDFPDAAIPIGIKMHSEIARRYLQR